jgi:senataxin
MRKIKASLSLKNSCLKAIGNRNLSIVRIGSKERVHKDSDEFNFELKAEEKCEELIRKEELAKSSSCNDQYKMFLSKKKHIEKTLKLAERDRDIAKSSEKKDEFKKMIEDLKDQISIINKRIHTFEVQLKKNSGIQPPAKRRKFKQQAREIVLKEADIIISTLNYCGNSFMDFLSAEKNNGRSLIDLVIVDEAAQSLEVESLIPLRFGCYKMIQVGDPEQLRATVLSQIAKVI